MKNRVGVALAAGALLSLSVPGLAQADPVARAQPLPPCMVAYDTHAVPSNGKRDDVVFQNNNCGFSPFVSVDVWGFDPECQIADGDGVIFYDIGAYAQYAYLC
ncbi:hypothetical protein ACPZ19_27450 [Amycolatopsis lurida]